MDIYNKPMAAAGLTSYRIKGRYGYIMIGATDHKDAWSEALRSSQWVSREDLEIWNGREYVNVKEAK